MQITKIGFESSVRYIGWRLKSPIMGHKGNVLVRLKNGDEVFQGGKLKATLSWSARGGLRVNGSGPAREIEIPLMKPLQTKRFKIPIHQLPFKSGILNLAHVSLEVINGDGEVLALRNDPLALTEEDIARERAQGKVILVITILTLVGVIASLILRSW